MPRPLLRLLAVAWSGRAMGWQPQWHGQGWGAAGDISAGSGCKAGASASSPGWAVGWGGRSVCAGKVWILRSPRAGDVGMDVGVSPQPRPDPGPFSGQRYAQASLRAVSEPPVLGGTPPPLLSAENSLVPNALPTDSCTTPWPPRRDPTHGSLEGDALCSAGVCSWELFVPIPLLPGALPTWAPPPRCCQMLGPDAHSWQPPQLTHGPQPRPTGSPPVLLCLAPGKTRLPFHFPPTSCLTLCYREGKAARSLLGVTYPQDTPGAGVGSAGHPTCAQPGW